MIKQINQQDTYSIRHQVMWPEKPTSYIKLPNDPEGLHYGLFVDDILVSVVSVFSEHGDYQFRKFATLEDYQGQGYGTALLKHVIDQLKQMGAKSIWCNARADKVDYYKRFGLSETDKTFEKGGRVYSIMGMTLS